MNTRLEELSFKTRVSSIGSTLKDTLPFMRLGSVVQGPFSAQQRKRENLILSAIESTQRSDAIPEEEQATHLAAALQEACEVIQLSKHQELGETEDKAKELEQEILGHLRLVKPLASLYVA
ncbi:hypothetical protein CL689_06680 [Candidatus Saccharibacteria bacterium]|nr:hypothetical protein [Candidatus Saccharibacteria bacterium]